MSTKLVYATRGSALALAQSRAFVATLQAAHPTVTFEERIIVSSGDKFQSKPLQEIGGKGVFIKELEEALLAGGADFAVHSIKDVPAEVAPGLCITAIPKREDPRDAVVSRVGGKLSELPARARVGTSSLRRVLALHELRPDLEIVAIRGNVDTRIRKARTGEVEAVVLALAGLRRLGLEHEVSEILSAEISVPAIGQGALGIECRTGDENVRAILATERDATTELCVFAERAFLREVGGSCRSPLGAYACFEGNDWVIRAVMAELDGSKVRRGSRRLLSSDTNLSDASKRAAIELAQELR